MRERAKLFSSIRFLSVLMFMSALLPAAASRAEVFKSGDTVYIATPQFTTDASGACPAVGMSDDNRRKIEKSILETSGEAVIDEHKFANLLCAASIDVEQRDFDQARQLLEAIWKGLPRSHSDDPFASANDEHERPHTATYLKLYLQHSLDAETALLIHLSVQANEAQTALGHIQKMPPASQIEAFGEWGATEAESGDIKDALYAIGEIDSLADSPFTEIKLWFSERSPEREANIQDLRDLAMIEIGNGLAQKGADEQALGLVRTLNKGTASFILLYDIAKGQYDSKNYTAAAQTLKLIEAEADKVPDDPQLPPSGMLPSLKPLSPLALRIDKIVRTFHRTVHMSVFSDQFVTEKSIALKAYIYCGDKEKTEAMLNRPKIRYQLLDEARDDFLKRGDIDEAMKLPGTASDTYRDLMKLAEPLSTSGNVDATRLLYKKALSKIDANKIRNIYATPRPDIETLNQLTKVVNKQISIDTYSDALETIHLLPPQDRPMPFDALIQEEAKNSDETAIQQTLDAAIEDARQNPVEISGLGFFIEISLKKYGHAQKAQYFMNRLQTITPEPSSTRHPPTN